MPHGQGFLYKDISISTETALPWFRAIGIIFIAAFAWGSVYLWAEVIEKSIEKFLKLPEKSIVSKLIMATVFTSILVAILFLIGGPRRIEAMLGNPYNEV